MRYNAPMPITTTAVATAVGKSVLKELQKRIRDATPQGRFEKAYREQVEDITLETAQIVQSLANRLDGTDQTIACLTDRTEEIAGIIYDVVDYFDYRISEVYRVPDHQAPPREDRENVAKEATKAYYYAGSEEKRQIIWEAINNSFNPRFYKEGLHKILWGIVERLEYPHFRVLKELQDGTYAHSILPNKAEATFFARRLAMEGLVMENVIPHERTGFVPLPIALKLLEFAPPPAPLVG